MFVGNLIFADDACDMNTLGPSLVNGMEDKLVMFYAWLRNKINGARNEPCFHGQKLSQQCGEGSCSFPIRDGESQLLWALCLRR